ncbi:DUF5989 family protein [Caldilinea sp.]|uniref:DUF5989 family protein n=1 Tax=Caldilinea sp. TaxID=2293560 RepID=UPI001AFED413|nr:DUF5989 family protein [Caldilinea sp.]MBO9394880.1 SGNH/GDSL hydrolase family protein [Caldilinea sp.]
MIRRLWPLILLLGVYAMLSVAALEIGLRVFQRVPPPEPPGFFWRLPDPVTGWSLIPNSSGRWYNAMYEFDVAVTINELGLRSPEPLTYAKKDGVYRILVIGDSFVEAMQVPIEQTFGYQLERLLNEAGVRIGDKTAEIEVINAGVGSWGTDQQLLWLRHEGYKFDPDLIVLAFYPANDFMNNYMPLEFANQQAVRKPWFELVDGQLQLNDFPFDPDKVGESRRRLRELIGVTANTNNALVTNNDTPGVLRGIGEWLHQYSALYRYLVPRLRVVAPHFTAWLAQSGLIEAGHEVNDLAQGPTYIPIAYGVYASPIAEPWPQALLTTRAILEEFKREADQLGAPLRSVLIPSYEEVDDRQWSRVLQRYPAMQAHRWDTAQPAMLTKQIFDEVGIPLLDLTPIMRQSAEQGKNLYFRDDRHFTPEGHAVAAHTLATWLTTDPEAALLSVQQPIPSPARAWGHLIWRVFVWSIVVLLVISLAWSIYKNGLRIWLRNVWLNLSTVGELLTFLVLRQNFVLLPLVVVLLIFGGLLIVAQASVVGPFIYTLF